MSVAIDWSEIFGLTVSPWELILRGTLIYWFIFLLFRFVARRDAGAIAITDVLVVVLIADAAQNGMSAEYRSVTDATILIATIVGWNVLLDWAAYVSPRLRTFLVPSALPLIRDGKLMQHNLRRQFLTEDEVKEKLREHGVTEFAEVQRAYLESDGSISVIKQDHEGDASQADRKSYLRG